MLLAILGVGIPTYQWVKSDAVKVEELLDEATRELSFGKYVDGPIAPSAEFADRLERAHAAIKRAIQIDDSSSRAHDCLGVYYLHRGELKSATREFQTAIRLDPRHPQPHVNMAVVYQRLGWWEDAIDECVIAQQMAPSFAPGYVEFGATLGQKYEASSEKSLVDLTTARQALERATSLDPGNFQAHSNLGIILELQGNYEAAVASHRRALDIHPNFLAAHYNLGLALMKAGLLSDAESEFRTVLSAAPNHGKSYHALAGVYLGQGQTRHAAAAVLEALRINPNDPTFHASLDRLRTIDLAAVREAEAEMRARGTLRERALSTTPPNAD